MAMIHPDLRGVVNQENLSVSCFSIGGACVIRARGSEQLAGVLACRLASIRFTVLEIVITAQTELLSCRW